MKILHNRNLFLLSYTESIVISSRVGFKFKIKELAFICRQLSSMLTSGLTLVKALEIIQKEQISQKGKKVFQEVYEDVQKGKSLSEALRSQNNAFPEFLISMVSAGEASGSLDTVMQRMADHYMKENKLNNKIRSAMIYPILLAIMTIAVVIGVFTFIMPKFMDMFEGVALPPLTQFVMALTVFFTEKWYILLSVLAGIGVACFIFYKSEAGRLAIHKTILKIPKIGKLVVKVYTGRFARTLSSLYASGISMVECLDKSSRVLGNLYINICFEDVIEDVKQGVPISAAISKTGVFESMFCSMIFVGEESGTLDEILEKTSDYYEDESDTALQRLIGIMDPIMIIVLAIIIGLVIASILPAMYTMLEGIK